MKRILLIVAIVLASCVLSFAQTTNRVNFEVATFAGGCFWCMEPPFDKLKGVKETISGYCGGRRKTRLTAKLHPA